MLRDILVLLSCASVGYAWLCAVAAPIVRAVRSVIRCAHSPRRSYESREAWLALALAAGAALVWTAIVAAAILLSMMLVPRAGLALLSTRLFWPGVAGGVIVWGGQLLATFRVPRFGDDLEAASALAMVAVFDDRPETLLRVHQLYAAHAIGPRDPRRLRLDASRPAAAA